jgi:hypothetical protein
MVCGKYFKSSRQKLKITFGKILVYSLQRSIIMSRFGIGVNLRIAQIVIFLASKLEKFQGTV